MDDKLHIPDYLLETRQIMQNVQIQNFRVVKWKMPLYMQKMIIHDLSRSVAKPPKKTARLKDLYGVKVVLSKKFGYEVES